MPLVAMYFIGHKRRPPTRDKKGIRKEKTENANLFHCETGQRQSRERMLHVTLEMHEKSPES